MLKFACAVNKHNKMLMVHFLVCCRITVFLAIEQSNRRHLGCAIQEHEARREMTNLKRR